MTIPSHADLALAAAVLTADRRFGAAQPFPAFFVLFAALSFAHDPPCGTIGAVRQAPAVVGSPVCLPSSVHFPFGALVVRAAARAG